MKLFYFHYSFDHLRLQNRRRAGPREPEPQVLTDGRSFWRPYGSFIHPLSLKEGNDLYFIMSAWNAYNTYLIHGKLN